MTIWQKKRKEHFDMRFKYTKEARSLATLLITGVTPFFSTTVFAADTFVSELPTVQIVSIEETNTPDIPTGECYVVVNVNIRKEPSKDSEIIGKYQKGEKINVISADDTWAKTDKGYIWGGYIVKNYGCDLNIHSDTEHSSLYVGQAYDIINKMEQKYINILKKYEIHLCSNPVDSYKGRSPLSDEMSQEFLNGITHIYIYQGIDERLMYLRGSSKLEYTIYHELGHAIDYMNIADTGNDSFFSDNEAVQKSFESEKKAVKEKFSIDEDVIPTEDEYFAESFRLSMTNPDELKETAPIISDYIEQVKVQLP